MPVHIAKAIRVSPLFGAAFLSELYQEGKLRMSHMRVGSSPLYMLPGQEPQLEQYIQFLNQKEKEACILLKNGKVLMDEKLHPAIRVALRAIKDFAIPFKININGEDKTHWRYFTESIDQPAPAAVPQIALEKELIQQPVVIPQQPIIEKVKEIPKIKEVREIEPEQTTSETNKDIETKKVRKKPQKEDSNFQKRVRNYLESNSIDIKEVLIDKKKEFVAKIEANTQFGKHPYYLFAKDKKKITEADMSLAIQRASMDKMPAVILSPGEMDKKSVDYPKTFPGLLKIQKL